MGEDFFFAQLVAAVPVAEYFSEQTALAFQMCEGFFLTASSSCLKG